MAEVTRKYPKVASVIVMESLDFRAPDATARAEHARRWLTELDPSLQRTDLVEATKEARALTK